MFILWICFVFHNVFTPLHQYTSVLNGKTNSTVARIASSLTPALSVVVDPSSAKERIDSYLAATYTKFSRTYITELINNGHVYVNNSKRKPSYRLREGDLVQIVANELQSNRSRGVNLKLDILYEDDYMMAINKAPGMIVHPGAGCPNETVANAVEFYISSKTNNADIVAASKTSSVEDRTTAILDSLHSSESFGNHIVHRLDKDSSGVLLVGKNKRITGALAQQFASREVVKYYLVVCVGNPGDTTIAKAIGRSLTDRKKMSVTGQGKAAVSHVVTLLFDGQLSVAMVRIDTGRTHQIRVHMKQRRTPVLGDDQYGSNKWNRQLIHGHKGADRKESSSHVRTQLHAYETHFTHPVTGERLSVRAPLPPDISTLINRIAMKNMLASNALPLFFFSPNRTEELQAVRKVTSSVAANPLRDSERMIESQQEILHRKLVGVVNKTSGFLQGNTDILYASLQKASDQYRQQHQEGRKTVGAHGYMGSKGFYVAEDAVRPSLDVMRDSSGNEVDLDEVWGEYEVDEGGRDGHRVNTGETSRDRGERRRRERSRRRDSSDNTDDEDDDSGYGEEEDDEEYEGGGGFIIEEEDEGEFDSEEEEEDFGITIEYDDDDEEDKRYNSETAEEAEDADASKDIDDEYSDDTDSVGDAEEDETDPDEEDDDWSVESIATARRSSKQSSGSDYDDDDGYDQDGEEEEVNFNAVKHWR